MRSKSDGILTRVRRSRKPAHPESSRVALRKGDSKGCSGTDIYSGLPAPHVIGAGWNATKGWDPVTGLGTPLFDKLLTQVKQKGYGYGGGYGGGYQA